MRTLLSAFIVITCLFCLSARGAEEWPNWAGPRWDETWRGPEIAPQLTDGKLPQVWTRPLGGGYSGITVSNGRAYVMDRPRGEEGPLDAERIVCFDPATGNDLWVKQYDAPYADLTYNSGPRVSVTIHEGKAYAIGAVGHIFCLDAATGQVIWQVDGVKELGAIRPLWGFAAAPFIYENLVLFQLGLKDGLLVALDKNTGKLVWKSIDDHPAGYCPPVLIEHPSGRPMLIQWTPFHIVGLDPRTGRVHWKTPYEIQNEVAVAPPFYRDGLLVVSAYWKGSKAYKLGPALGDVSLVWENEHEVRGLMNQAVYHDGHAFILDRQDGVVCFEVKSGKKIWDDGHKLTPRARHPQVVIVSLNGSDRVIALNSAGELVHARMNKQGYEELWRAPIIDQTWAHFAFHGDLLIARSDTQMVCVKLPVAE